MPLRRESPLRGRRLRIHESLIEQALMSPLGYQFLLHMAPRIDKVLIPPTNGRLSSIGIGRVGSFACDLSPEATYRPSRSAVFTACSVTRQC